MSNFEQFARVGEILSEAPDALHDLEVKEVVAPEELLADATVRSAPGGDS